MRHTQHLISSLKRLEIDVHRGVKLDDRPDWLKDMPSARDNTALYYQFLYHLCRSPEPLNVLEIGTYKGTSAAHMAYGMVVSGNGGGVTTLDIDPEARRLAYTVAAERNLPIHAMLADSSSPDALAHARMAAPFDVLFIDSIHNFSQAYDEYQRYRDLVKDDGYIFFDDTSLGAEMQALWDFIADPKIKLDLLHYTGFGAALKSPVVKVPALADLDREKVLAAVERYREP